MKPRSSVQLVAAALVSTLASIGGCSLFPSHLTPTPTPSVSPSPPPAAASPTTGQPGFRPASRIMTISIEGQPTEMQLELFDPEELPFSTYIPAKDFQEEIRSADSEMDVLFYFSPTGTKDEKAYIKFFSPAQNVNVEGIQDLLLGEQGMFVQNDWELADRTTIVSYPWAREKFIYQGKQGNDTVLGSIYIGEHQGQAFYILTHYPAEYAEGFEPRSSVILENLQFDDQK